MLVHIQESPRVLSLEEDGYVLSLHAPEPNGGVHCALQTIEEVHCALQTIEKASLDAGQEALGCLGLLRIEGSECSLPALFLSPS